MFILFFDYINYNPLDKEIFKNNIELWRIKCYNVIGVI
jgi:hypothetical protein